MLTFPIDNKLVIDNLVYFQKKLKIKSNRKLAGLTKGGVSDRHIGNIKKNDSSPTLEVIKSLASAFKIESWQLLLPIGMMDKKEMIYEKKLQEVIDNYLASSEKGKELILYVANSSEKK